ncbi:MAG: hypothetical protein EAZ92_11600 [Candidatus Kapaibacterium sp.]|nr:MAG: hypothetical protein EAZ92_11600 [Candidatus Kapabacteria bacterium]
MSVRFFLFVCAFLLCCEEPIFAQTKPQASQAKQQQFSKPIAVFDASSMMLAQPGERAIKMATKLQAERGFGENLSAVRDRSGMLRIAYLPGDGMQSNCTPYADMYFDKTEKWLSTEEYFVVESDSTRSVGKIWSKIMANLKAKNMEMGRCLELGQYSLWRISTPLNIWYECEVFKKGASSIALVIPTEKAPYLAPNPNIFGTAYFDKQGNLVKIQAKSKVKELNPDLVKTASN